MLKRASWLANFIMQINDSKPCIRPYLDIPPKLYPSQRDECCKRLRRRHAECILLSFPARRRTGFARRPPSPSRRSISICIYSSCSIARKANRNTHLSFLHSIRPAAVEDTSLKNVNLIIWLVFLLGYHSILRLLRFRLLHPVLYPDKGLKWYSIKYKVFY